MGKLNPSPQMKAVRARQRGNQFVIEELRATARAIRRRYDPVHDVWTREAAMHIAEWIEERAARLAKASKAAGKP